MVALMLYVSGVAVPLVHPVAPLWVYATLSSIFTFAGLALVVSHRRDHRAEWLGALFTMIGCPLVRPLIAGGGAAPLEWLESFHPEVFTPACAWGFAAAFPLDLRGRAARVVRGITFACAMIAAALVGVSLMSAWDTGPLQAVAVTLNRVPRDRVSPIWLLQAGLAAPALVVLLWRALRAPAEARRRVALFVAAFCGGLGPITLELLAEGIWPEYAIAIHQPSSEPWITAVLFVGLGTLPFSMGYAVLFDRVVETHIALQAAAQYLLARYIVGLLTLIPFGGLFLYLVRHREDSLTSLFSGAQRPTILLVSALAGIAAVYGRPLVIRMLDRRYYREPYDGRRMLGELTGTRGPTSLTELGHRVHQEITNAFHARITVFLMQDDLAAMQPVGSALPPIPAFSPLLRFDDGGGTTVDIATDTGRRLLASLDERERRWLVDEDVRMIAAARSRVLGTVGLIAAGPKQSGLAYTADDGEFLSAIAAAVGLTFDSLRLTRAHVEPAIEPVARECEGCGSVYGPETASCRCGRPLREGTAPYVLRGVFRFERRIGSGGVGVVYRAVDLSLGRTVAIKVLSATRPDQVETLMREARDMAGMSHEHLAVIHAVERWGQTPLLVQEYLEGGTLAQRLATAALPPAAVAELGEVLCDVLERVHEEGIVHCDVKPSNIGYTRDGVLKLFDFSLARRLPVIPDDDATGEAGDGKVLVDSGGVCAGTPYYMSPEAIHGAPPVPAFDWWSLAVVLFEALTGRRPFDGPDTPGVLASILFQPVPRLRTFRPELPDEIGDFFFRVFDRTQNKRMSTAKEFLPLLTMLKGLTPPPGVG
jgi:hypothetical protein